MKNLFIKRNSRGFTLIELLVVIAIIGTLSTIAFVSLRGATDTADDTKLIADIRNIKSALEFYYSDNGNYPRSSAAWTCGPGDTALTGLGVILTNVDISDWSKYQYAANSVTPANVTSYILTHTDILGNTGYDALIGDLDNNSTGAATVANQHRGAALTAASNIWRCNCGTATGDDRYCVGATV